jgi:hypothetical protein
VVTSTGASTVVSPVAVAKLSMRNASLSVALVKVSALRKM